MTESAINELFLLLTSATELYFGEQVTQLEHALQCASAAQQANAGNTLVAAALLHDVGHLLGSQSAETELELDEYGIPSHENVGAAYLRRIGVSETIAKLVAGHVPAKRYLTATDPAYYSSLSEASKETLRRQGGPMTQEEVRAFASQPLCNEIIQLRRWDEEAKIPGLQVPELESYRPILADC
jgi:phosphonate degradation associated HDIG domain protein